MKTDKPPVVIRSEKRIIPHSSIDHNEFNKQYRSNPGRWDKAFQFLREADLAGLAKGRYELDGTVVFAIIDEYVTKNEIDTRLEAHRRYADIQYVNSGSELMGIVSLDKTTETVPYDEEKDICFLESEHERLMSATPDRYFIFFPDDAHRPSLKAGENALVKKVIMKVRIV